MEGSLEQLKNAMWGIVLIYDEQNPPFSKDSGLHPKEEKYNSLFRKGEK